jgi:hypothetical protein
MGYMDYVRSSTGSLPTVVNYGFIVFGILCLVTLLIKLTAFVVRKLRKSDKKYTKADKMILAQQEIFAGSGIIYALFTMFISGTPTKAFLTVSCLLAAALGILSLANGVILCYNTIKGDMRTRTKIKQYIWAATCIAYAVFIAIMQLYCFWKL